MHYCGVVWTIECNVTQKNIYTRSETSMEKNRIRPITNGKKFAYELCKAKRSIADAEFN